jgi:hypothetical protein
MRIKPMLELSEIDASDRAEGTKLQLRKKRGGRRKGSKNRRTLERAKVLAAIKASGADPVSFFADLLQNESAPLDLRFQAAKELAPYVHPRLASIESRLGARTHEDKLAEYRHLLSDDGKPPSLRDAHTLTNLD